ncbi:bifunctional 3-(3-hydroxy-phenyl)propionate/3-hydroxycinnamic acid hydroxylase [Streptomyces sp. J2-1]|uniref:bifunctional 3-(3-hydroxy-phenyl)propionate/3-hydroxycinnamic acid hydroxylase n=1 Tax=Streptomyces corallincola TaxID=2851888 RepID=UPI001C38D581|nr:bifunctional 3-(3-hydroxy-phenyl)propionate/3-hydroxycinnamic acid hydroxylase [Streptomyces corallincola]MBV2353895.1 bifunctional 3-(3-hydroxy-phenyl)propionate/3-hydroxycinnamic acid hydroxylase [Streptomyces corallincola]
MRAHELDDAAGVTLEADVAVVGAGPVGMTAAALLAAHGLGVVVVERNATTSDAPKAISIDDEALRVYQAAGLAERAMRIILPGTGTKYFDADGEPVFQARAEVPYRFGHPFKNPFAQPDLERELHAHLSEHPRTHVLMGTELTGLTQDEWGAELRCRSADGPVTVKAAYVLGCDGGRSKVREVLDIGMTGRSFQDVWLVADVLQDPHTERYGMHHGDPERPHVIVPGRDGRCRYEFYLYPGECAAGDPPPFELVRRLLEPFRPLAPEQIQRAVTYRFNAVVADRWRVGRCFLLGDAAHMMPPFAGQGLNSGIRDAANLCWKIADVLGGRLTDEALDTYETERRPHAEATVALSARLGRIVMTTDARYAARRDAYVRDLIATPEGRAYLEHMRYRPAHHYTDGLVDTGADADGADAAPAGVMIGQPRVFDVEHGRVRLLDEVTGNGWVLLGVGVPEDGYAAVTAALAPLRPVVAHVAVGERLPSSPDAPRVLVDVDGGLETEMAPYRGRYVLLRPDRFVAASWAPDALPELAKALALNTAGDALPLAG